MSNQYNSTSTFEMATTEPTTRIAQSSPLLRTILNPSETCNTTEEEIHRGIYWRSPICMVSFFFLGLLSFAAHHFWYYHLNGRPVGSAEHQQWAIRLGNICAHVGYMSLVCAVGYSFTQVLWKTLKQKEVSVEALDAAFDADRTLWSLRLPEIWWKLRVVTFLSLVSGLLFLSALFTPATLSVVLSVQNNSSQISVPRLDLYGPQWKQFAYSINTTSKAPLQFLGPRTVLTRLTTATASQGIIIPIVPPSINSTYAVKFFGPAVQCQDANDTTSAIIEALRDLAVAESNTGSLVEYENDFYAFVPDISRIYNGTDPTKGVQVVPQTRQETTSPATNELWMVNSKFIQNSANYIDLSKRPNGTINVYTVCKLHNASYDLNFSFNDGAQNVTQNEVTILNAIGYPTDDLPSTPDVRVQHAYSAVFWALTDLIVGSIGMYTHHSESNWSEITNTSEITSQIQYTILLGSSDLDVFFSNEHFLSSKNPNPGAQRLQDIALAQNQTLSFLIPQLAFNITASFMSNHLLSPYVPTNVTQFTPINIYTYHWHTLIRAYSIALSFAFIGVCFGGWGYVSNGYSHNKTFSAILGATRESEEAEFKRLFHADMLGRLPLHEKVRKTKLMFRDRGDEGKGFIIINRRRV